MFKRYTSIENSYRQKYIMKAVGEFPELMKTKFIIQEKIDGSNLQLFFEPDKPMKVGKRSSFLSEDSGFFDVWNTLDKYSFDNIQSHVDRTGDVIRIFGELYGQGVQKRVNYGDSKSFAIFDIEMNGSFISQKNLSEFADDFGFSSLLVPTLAFVDSLNEALSFDVDFDSEILGIENNAAEGIVIKPYEKEYTMHSGNRFVVKKKSDTFAEKMKVKQKRPVEVSGEVVLLNLKFREYINDNRVLSIYSKYGPLEDMKEFGKYVGLVLDDAKEDFLKENELPELDKKEIKQLYNVGNTIALLLKGNM